MLKCILPYICKAIGILLMLSGISCRSHNNEQRRVLVIESFESEYFGYKGQERKVLKCFQKEGINAEIRTFYLDCDSYREQEELKRTYNFLDSIATWKPEIIIVNNDQATYSLMACGHPLIKQVPVVFAGVNFPNWTLIKQHPNITGFWDKMDFMGTAKMVEQMFGPMRIRFWQDNTYLGRQSIQQMLEELNAAGIKNVGNHSYAKDENGKFYLYRDSTKHESILFHKPQKMEFSYINARETSSNILLCLNSATL